MQIMKDKEIKGVKKTIFIILRIFLFVAFNIVLLCSNIHFVNSTTDISKYHKKIDTFDKFEKVYNCKEKLVVFPRELKESYQINEFYYANVFQFFNQLGEHFILDITFKQEDFLAEIERLKSWEIVDIKDNTSDMLKLLYSENLFRYPAYIACHYLNDYEYALILSDTRIVYIYVNKNIEYSFFGKKITPLEDEFLPGKYFERIDVKNLGFVYSVYGKVS